MTKTGLIGQIQKRFSPSDGSEEAKYANEREQFFTSGIYEFFYKSNSGLILIYLWLIYEGMK